MKFVLGSSNKAKKQALEEWLNNNFEQKCEIETISVESNVSAQPLSIEATIEGAINRAKNALNKSKNADFGVGLEGGVFKVGGKMFLNGWASIVSKDGEVMLGAGPSVELPAEIVQKLENGIELGEVMEQMHKRDVRNFEGAFGILTKNMITRTKSFELALICAWAKNEYAWI